jgi:hypothetical protein
MKGVIIMAKTLDQKIVDAELRKEQAQNEYDLLMAKFNEREQKAKNERIIKRGEQIEKALPEIISLTKKQFEKFVECVLVTDYTRREIKKIIAETETSANQQSGTSTVQNGNNIPQKPVDVAARTEPAPNAKSAHQAQGGSRSADGNAGNGAVKQA